jgi:hypothetical protein
MDQIELPWTTTGDGLLMRVRLTPKSSSDSIGGIAPTAEGSAISARVRAVPADGKANSALKELVAEWLGVPKSSVALVSGGKSRIKSIAIRGEPQALARELAAKIGH